MALEFDKNSTCQLSMGWFPKNTVRTNKHFYVPSLKLVL